MPYQIIQPPFSLKFREMPRKELKAYYAWFHQVMPDRIAELTQAVQQSAGFASWRPDRTAESLELLGQWFAANVTTRLRTEEELAEKRARMKFPFPLSTWELTNRTFSLAVDIGMYVSQVFLANHPSLRWQHFLKGKTFDGYGQPVLIGFGKMYFNPVGMMVTHAYAIARDKRTGTDLRKIYETWVAMIEGEQSLPE